MNITVIIISTLVVAVCGLLVGIGLGVFAKKFAVHLDPREAQIREALPGNNCGACGYPGCDALAKAINEGKAGAYSCPVGGPPVGKVIAAITGETGTESNLRMRATVLCIGTCDKAVRNYTYTGITDCSMATRVPGWGGKACEYGCLGFGTCLKVCDFNAINIVDGVALINRNNCIGCGKCVKACPKHLIQLVPVTAPLHVHCLSQDKGRVVRQKCQVGCIGCQICVKNCPAGAIHMDGNHAAIDYKLCTGCGICAEKCPNKLIK